MSKINELLETQTYDNEYFKVAPITSDRRTLVEIDNVLKNYELDSGVNVEYNRNAETGEFIVYTADYSINDIIAELTDIFKEEKILAKISFNEAYDVMKGQAGNRMIGTWFYDGMSKTTHFDNMEAFIARIKEEQADGHEVTGFSINKGPKQPISELENKKIGENTMSRAAQFLKSLNKLPERYQLILEDISKSEFKDLIPQDLAIVLTKMSAAAMMSNNVTLFVKNGTGKDAAEGKGGKSTETRTANDWTVTVYGGLVEMNQPVVSVYNSKTRQSWTASTSKENLKKWSGGKSESKVTKKSKNEAFFSKNGEATFETLSNLKKELSSFGLKDGQDFKANLFGSSLELYLAMAADALPEQINDLINRYGFLGGEGSVEFKKEVEVTPEEETNVEPQTEAKKKVLKKKILIKKVKKTVKK